MTAEQMGITSNVILRRLARLMADLVSKMTIFSLFSG